MTDNKDGGIPPQAIDSEKLILGSILIDPNILERIYWGYFPPSAFFKTSHKTIFNEMVEIAKSEGTVNFLLLQQALEGKGILEAIGGVDSLIDIANSGLTCEDVEEHVCVVMESYRKRTAIKIAGNLLHDSMSNEISIDEAFDTVITSIDELQFLSSDFFTFVEIYEKNSGRINENE